MAFLLDAVVGRAHPLESYRPPLGIVTQQYQHYVHVAPQDIVRSFLMGGEYA